MLYTRYKPAFERVALWPARLLARLGVSPSAITIAGFVLVIACCLFYLMTGRTVAFCVLVTLSSLFDVLDGAVARLTNRVTRFGAYLDAMTDRYGESIVVLTVATMTGYWALSLWLLAGSLITSYAKARAAMEVPISNYEWPDFMERGERDIAYIVGLAVSVLVPVTPGGHDIFWWTLLILCILVHGTVLQRLMRARRIILARSANQ